MAARCDRHRRQRRPAALAAPAPDIAAPSRCPPARSEPRARRAFGRTISPCGWMAHIPPAAATRHAGQRAHPPAHRDICPRARRTRAGCSAELAGVRRRRRSMVALAHARCAGADACPTARQRAAAPGPRRDAWPEAYHAPAAHDARRAGWRRRRRSRLDCGDVSV